jgi:hypothetical protein
VPKPTAAVARFPDRELEIRRLHARDADFREVCEDYEEAMKALQYWQAPGHSDKAKAEDYRQLVAEFETELLAKLDRRRGALPPNET